MSKKIVVSLVLAWLIAMLFTNIAFAAAESPATSQARGGRRMYGEIVEIGTDQLTIENPHGGLFTYLVDETTCFYSPEIEDPTFADIQVGQKVAVTSRWAISGSPVARAVVLLSEDFDPADRFGVRAIGQIAEIDLDKSTFTVVNGDGEELTFTVGEETRFRGKAGNLGEMQVDWFAAVGAQEMDDGTFLASLVLSGDHGPRGPVIGTVLAVNTATDNFTLLTPREVEVTFVVDENTRFHSREGEVESLADLEPDMVAIVIGQQQIDGVFYALRVAAGKGENLPHFEVKTGGTIVDIGDEVITIETQEGEQLTFQVTDQTRFRSFGGMVRELADLQLGGIALIGGEELENGTLVARAILAGRSRNP